MFSDASIAFVEKKMLADLNILIFHFMTVIFLFRFMVHLVGIAIFLVGVIGFIVWVFVNFAYYY